MGNGNTPAHLEREGVGCKDPSCLFGERIGWWLVIKSLPVGLEGSARLSTADIERLQLMHNINVDHLAINKFRSKSQKH